MIDNESVSGRAYLTIVHIFAQLYTISLPVKLELHLVWTLALIASCGKICFYNIIKFHFPFLLVVRDRRATVTVIHVVAVEEPVVSVGHPRVVGIVTQARPPVAADEYISLLLV